MPCRRIAAVDFRPFSTSAETGAGAGVVADSDAGTGAGASGSGREDVAAIEFLLRFPILFSNYIIIELILIRYSIYLTYITIIIQY